MTFKKGNRPWNKDRTKETDTRIEKYGKVVSSTRKSKHLIPWNKGKTGKEDKRISDGSAKAGKTFKERGYKSHNKGKKGPPSPFKGTTKYNNSRAAKISRSKMGHSVTEKVRQAMSKTRQSNINTQFPCKHGCGLTYPMSGYMKHISDFHPDISIPLHRRLGVRTLNSGNLKTQGTFVYHNEHWHRSVGERDCCIELQIIHGEHLVHTNVKIAHLEIDFVISKEGIFFDHTDQHTWEKIVEYHPTRTWDGEVEGSYLQKRLKQFEDVGITCTLDLIEHVDRTVKVKSEIIRSNDNNISEWL